MNINDYYLMDDYLSQTTRLHLNNHRVHHQTKIAKICDNVGCCFHDN